MNTARMGARLQTLREPLRGRADTPTVVGMAKRGRVSKPDLAEPDVIKAEAGQAPSRGSRSAASPRAPAATSVAKPESNGLSSWLRLADNRFEPLAWFAAHERLWVNAGLVAGLGAGVLSAFGQRRAARTLAYLAPPFLLGGIYCRLAAGKSAGRTTGKSAR
jgi:hypothetical protein